MLLPSLASSLAYQNYQVKPACIVCSTNRCFIPTDILEERCAVTIMLMHAHACWRLASFYTPQAWQTENPGSQVPDPIQGVSLDQLYKLGLAEVGGRGMACNQGFSDRRGEGGFARGISAWQPGRDG